MKNKSPSAYQKMFLVTPSVYQKLLSSIEEKDKVAVEELNMKKDLKEDKSISEKLLEKISGKDMGIQVGSDIPTAKDTIPYANPTPIVDEFIPEVLPEIVPEQPIITQTIETPIQDVQNIYTNPLDEKCPQDTDQGSIIPDLFYKPSIKNKVGKKTSPIAALSDQSDLRKLRSGKVITNEAGFPCHICSKKYTRKHDLKRHLESKTAHKGFNQNINLDDSVNKSDSENEEFHDTFDYWSDGKNLSESNTNETLLEPATPTPKKRGRPKNISTTKPIATKNVTEFPTWTVKK
jgi:hypothetical protein